MDHHKARLTDQDVLVIRKEYIKGTGLHNRGNSMKLAKKYGVTTAQILHVAKRKQWTHIK